MGCGWCDFVSCVCGVGGCLWVWCWFWVCGWVWFGGLVSLVFWGLGFVVVICVCWWFILFCVLCVDCLLGVFGFFVWIFLGGWLFGLRWWFYLILFFLLGIYYMMCGFAFGLVGGCFLVGLFVGDLMFSTI